MFNSILWRCGKVNILQLSLSNMKKKQGGRSSSSRSPSPSRQFSSSLVVRLRNMAAATGYFQIPEISDSQVVGFIWTVENREGGVEIKRLFRYLCNILNYLEISVIISFLRFLMSMLTRFMSSLLAREPGRPEVFSRRREPSSRKSRNRLEGQI